MIFVDREYMKKSVSMVFMMIAFLVVSLQSNAQPRPKPKAKLGGGDGTNTTTTTTTTVNNEKGITFFHGTWQELMDKAKKDNKPFFVDVYAVWCGPCKWMSANTFTDASVGEYANANFVSYKLDGEKGEGPGIMEKYKIEAYPTILFFNSKGELTGKEVGANKADAFLEILKKYKK